MDDRERLRQRFNRGFSYFAIDLPVEAMSAGSVWSSVGWLRRLDHSFLANAASVHRAHGDDDALLRRDDVEP